jgi:hypothetical protein
MIVAALMWSTWKHQNDVLFGRCSWSGMQVLLMRVVKLLKRWQMLCPAKNLEFLKGCVKQLQAKMVAAQLLQATEEAQDATSG